MSSEEDITNRFSAADYVVFVVVIVISACIGFVFGWVDRKKKSTKDFLLGGGDLKVFPVGISMMASFTSAIAILGFSSEMYLYGTMYWIVVLSYPFTQGLAALVYVPLFHGLKLTTAYQLRFNKYVHITASIVFCLQMFLYMSVALYTPALAIEQVTKIPLEISIAATGAICALYTVAGGMKATVWIDTFQVGIMFAGLITIIIATSLSVEGGFNEIWRRLKATDRLEFFDFDPNPVVRHSFWTLFVGAFFTNLTVYASNQGTIQRYLSVKKWENAAKALMINLVGGILLLTVTCLTGIVAYGKYYDCDLLGSKKISKGEQMLPYLAMDVLGHLHGLPGLLVATIYSAALSTISAGMNALAAVCITDFIRPAYLILKKKPIDERVATAVTKGLALGFGAAAIGFAIIIQFLGNTVLQLSLSIFGLLGGPLLGVISLGIFVPFANWVGALVGLIASTVFNIAIGLAGIIDPIPAPKKYLTIEGCSNYTLQQLGTTTLGPIKPPKVPTVHHISYQYYSLCAMIICMGLGIVCSLIADKFNLIEKKEVDPSFYIHYPCMKRKPASNKVQPFAEDDDSKLEKIEMANQDDEKNELNKEQQLQEEEYKL